MKERLQNARRRKSSAGNALPSRSLWQKAFTLTELMVTLALVSILASLLLPVLSRVKAKAQSMLCSSHLQQLQMGWLMYAHDHDGRLPPDRIDYNDGYWQSLPGSWVLGNAQRDRTAANIQSGVLFAYSPSPSIYRCPTDSSIAARLKGALRTRSYSLNAFLNTEIVGEQYVPGWDWLPTSLISRVDSLRDKRIEPAGKTRDSQLLNPPPVKVFVFLDVQEQSIDAGGFNLHPYLESWEHLPADRHSQGANLSFADGHVEHYRWRVPKKFVELRPRIEDELERLDFKRLAAGVPFQP